MSNVDIFELMLGNLTAKADHDFLKFLEKLSTEQKEGIKSAYLAHLADKTEQHFDPLFEKAAMDYWNNLIYFNYDECLKIRIKIENNSRDVIIFSEKAEVRIVGANVHVIENGYEMHVQECYYVNHVIEYWVMSFLAGSYGMDKDMSFNMSTASSKYVFFELPEGMGVYAFSVELCEKIAKLVHQICQIEAAERNRDNDWFWGLGD